ncbi:MAG TPA: ABC transporter permease [Gaiellaceae bacterium]|jgi:peptide/nickel transport system permease protein|nr:ABC transporter permease [Gaiellaceae bacterium]
MTTAPDPLILVPEQLTKASDDARVARRERLRLVLRSKTFLVGSVIFLFWIFCALFGEMVAPKNPFASDPLNRLASPSGEFWFGTDRLGRDVFSRVLAGAREILTVAPLATLLGTGIGTILGLVTGYFRGLVDDAIMRLMDALLAVPLVILALLALVALGPSNTTVIVVIGIVFTPLVARTVRAAVLSEAQLEYVQAARLRNERAPYIMFAEILPNVLPPVIVEFTVRLGYAVFTIAALSFLGFGIQPPAPDWGLQVFENYGFLSANIWWPVLFPAVAIASLVVAVNLISDGITQAFER